MPKRANTVVEYRVYDLPLDFPAMLLEGEAWRISDVMSSRLHFHNCLEIGLCHTDGGSLVIGERTAPFRAGDVTCIPRHIPHTTCSDAGTRSLWSYAFLDMEQLSGVDGPVPGDGAGWVFSQASHPRVHFLATAIVEELRAARQDCAVVAGHLLALLRHELLRLRDDGVGEITGSARPFRLQPALEHIARHYMHPIAVGELAALCGLSATHFRRLFVAAVGTSPIGFLNATRVRRACALLLTGGDSILSIAEAVGFSTISSFNRCFLQVMGMSPRAYRDAAGKQVVRYRGWMKAEPRPNG